MAQAMEGETFLNAIKTTWQDHKISMGKIRDVNKYLVRLMQDGDQVAELMLLFWIAGQDLHNTREQSFRIHARTPSIPYSSHSTSFNTNTREPT